MQKQSLDEDEVTRTIYTVTLSRNLYDALKRITMKTGNLYVGNTIVQLLEENPKVKKELKIQ
jgi:hypothetical protein